MRQIICDVCGEIIPDEYECRHLSITDKTGKFCYDNLTGESSKYTVGNVDLCRNCAKKFIEQCGFEFGNTDVASKTENKKINTVHKQSKDDDEKDTDKDALCSWTKLPCSKCIPSGCNFRIYR